MPRALVTGGAGFIGSHLVERLCASGYTVRVLDNLTSGALSNLATCLDRLEFVEGDILDEDVVASAVVGVETVFHLAADVSVPRSVAHPTVTLDRNVRGTAVVAYAAAAAGASRFVFASSSAVYGETGQAPVPEDTPTRPLSPYGASKLMSECLLGAMHRSGQPSALCFRFFNVYGPRQAADSPYSGVVAQFLARARDGTPLTIYGDGGQTRDFVAIGDLVDLLVSAVERDPHTWPSVVNVGTGLPTTVSDLADAVLACATNPPPVCHEPERQGDLRYSCADIHTAVETLGWRPGTTLQAGISDLWHTPAASAL